MREKLLRFICMACLCLAVCSACLAQIGQVGKLDEPYKLQPEDTLQIQVFGQTQIAAVVPIGPDGTVSAPFLGSVKAAGRTLDELMEALTALYEKKLRLRDPIVSVTISQFRQRRASIGGAVSRPGSVMIRPGDTVLTLYNNGGGASADIADLRRSYLRHANSIEIIPMDLYAMTVLGDMSQNYQLQDGDEITVPEERNNRIIVSGSVARPGQFPYHEPMTLADAIALAGGEIRYRSKFSHTIVIRQRPGLPGQYVTLVYNFVRFVKDPHDPTQNAVLQPGDYVYVPETDTPDYNQIASLFNIAYIFDVLGGGNVFTRVLGG